MKKYFAVNGGDVFVEYDTETKQSTTLILSNLRIEKQDIEDRIAQDANIPEEECPTCKQMYKPSLDHSVEIARLEEVTNLIGALESL